MATLLNDLRYGVRSLLKTPGFTLAAIAALALGIGANTAIFSIVDAVILQALQFPGGERVVMLWEQGTREGTENSSTSLPVALAWAERQDTFEAVGGFFTVDANLTGVDEPTRLSGVRAMAGMFAATGATALHGRTLTAEEDTWGAPPVTVLSHAAQRTREIGVRVALGAARPNLYRLVLGEAGRIAAWGIAVGSAAALALARLAKGLLYDTSPADPSVFASICAGVLLLALFASWVPARRAASVAPMVALKSE